MAAATIQQRHVTIIEFKEHWEGYIFMHYLYMDEGACIGKFYLDIQSGLPVIVSGLYVAEEHRQKGLGKIMMGDAIKKYPLFGDDLMLRCIDGWRVAWYRTLGFETLTMKRGTPGYRDKKAGYSWMKYDSKKHESAGNTGAAIGLPL